MNTKVAQLNGWRFKALILLMTASIVGYLAMSLWGGRQEVFGAFLQIGAVGTFIALLLSSINYGLRFIRWQVYLTQLGYRISWLPSLRIYLSGFALTATPGKAGEMFRGVLLKQRNVLFSSTVAAFICERLSDLLAIVLLALIGLSHYPPARSMVLAGALAIGVVFICISSATILVRIHQWSNVRAGKPYEFLTQITCLLIGARRCHTPGLLLVATALSVAAWGAEALAFYWVLGWLGADISFSFAVFVYALSLLAGALSFLPGGLGSAEAVMISLLVLKGMAMPAAIAATVFIRLATLWFAVLIGLLALYRSRKGETV
jgi:uncharacterized protein (TIRG00374 family)